MIRIIYAAFVSAVMGLGATSTVSAMPSNADWTSCIADISGSCVAELGLGIAQTYENEFNRSYSRTIMLLAVGRKDEALDAIRGDLEDLQDPTLVYAANFASTFLEDNDLARDLIDRIQQRPEATADYSPYRQAFEMVFARIAVETMREQGVRNGLRVIMPLFEIDERGEFAHMQDEVRIYLMRSISEFDPSRVGLFNSRSWRSPVNAVRANDAKRLFEIDLTVGAPMLVARYEDDDSTRLGLAHRFVVIGEIDSALEMVEGLEPVALAEIHGAIADYSDHSRDVRIFHAREALAHHDNIRFPTGIDLGGTMSDAQQSIVDNLWLRKQQVEIRGALVLNELGESDNKRLDVVETFISEMEDGNTRFISSATDILPWLIRAAQYENVLRALLVSHEAEVLQGVGSLAVLAHSMQDDAFVEREEAIQDYADFEAEAVRLGALALEGRAPIQATMRLFSNPEFGCDGISAVNYFGEPEITSILAEGICEQFEQGYTAPGWGEQTADLDAARSKAWNIDGLLWPGIDLCLPLSGFALVDRMLHLMEESDAVRESVAAAGCSTSTLEGMRTDLGSQMGLAE